MAQAITAFGIFMIVTIGVVVFLNRRTRDKIRDSAIETDTQNPRAGTKRQQRVVDSFDPPTELPTIEELVAQEVADTDVNEIAGGDGLDVSLKLRVYWRDEVVRRGCTDGALEFRIAEGVAADEAETDDVRLVCVRAGGVMTDTEPDEGGAADNPESGEDTGPTGA